MALRQTPAEYAFVHALDGPPPTRKLSRGMVVAIGIPRGFAAYVIHQRFMVPQPAVDDTPAVIMRTVPLTQPEQPKPQPKPLTHTLTPHTPPTTFDVPPQTLTN